VQLKDLNPLPIQQSMANRNAPVYLVAPREKTEAEIRLFSRVKKEARLFFRSFDRKNRAAYPSEKRLTA
jgi:hypothetical protein